MTKKILIKVTPQGREWLSKINSDRKVESRLNLINCSTILKKIVERAVSHLVEMRRAKDLWKIPNNSFRKNSKNRTNDFNSKASLLI
jgi:hypothetical protein